MKIVTIAHSYSNKSGWGRYAYSVTKELESRGHVVKRVQVSHDIRKNFKSLINFKFAVWKTIWAGIGSDVIHAFDVWPLGVIGAIAAALLNKPLFITGVATYSVPSPYSQIKASLSRWSIRKARKLMSVSHYTENRIIERSNGGNFVVVHWGKSEWPRVDEKAQSDAQEKFALPKNALPRLITVGQIKDRKGQLEVAKAVAILKQEYPQIIYLIVGDDSDTNYVNQIRGLGLEQNVRIVSNAKDDQDLIYLYKNSDIFLLVSNNGQGHFEGFGLTMLEAESFGLPVIGTRDCGVAEALEDGQNGFVVSQRSPDEIVEKVRKILKLNKGELAKTSQEFASRFTWQKTVDKYLEYYKEA